MTDLDATAPLVEVQEELSAGTAKLQAGRTLDQYVVLRKLGSGGAGDVHLGWDTRLDRHVALKVLHRRDVSDTATQQNHDFKRLVSEARLVAKLSHPNVVTVFDVREVDGLAFIAMEYIDGTDLATFLRRERPRWPEVLRVFVAAGRGVQAAHDAGIVHGDFKPANVLLGEDMRARVGDFGVARTMAEQEALSSVEPSEGTDEDLSRSGGSVSGSGSAVAGTPYYMAPEQHAGAAATVVSDVYAFCVSFWEGLHGVPPFDATSVFALEDGKRSGPPQPPGSVPRWLTDILATGLQPDPTLRPQRMADLIEALTQTPRRRRRRWWVGAGTLGSVAIAGGFTQLGSRGQTPCSGAADELASVWNEPRRDALARAFANSERAFASDTWQRLEAAVEDYATAWEEQHTAVCQATERGERSEQLLDLGMACLERRRMELDAVLARLSDASDEAVQRAVPTVAALQTASICGETEHLLDRAGWQTPPRTPEVVAIERLLAEASSHRELGTFDEGYELAMEAIGRAEAIEHRYLWVEALHSAGNLAQRRGEFEEAEERLAQAAWEAEAIGHDDIAAVAAIEEVVLVGHELQRHDDAIVWASHADAAVRRVGAPPRLAGNLASNKSTVLRAKGDPGGAYDLAKRAVSTLEAVGGHPLAAALDNLANAAMSSLDGEQARIHGERALGMWRALLGPDHPSVANSMGNLADTLMRVGDVDAGLEMAAAAEAIARKSLAPDHPLVVRLVTNHANCAALAGRTDDARRGYSEALELYRLHDPRARHVGSVAYNLGMLLLSLEEPQEARERFVLALDVWESVLGKEHPQLVLVLIALGAVQHQLGDVEASIPLLERAVGLAETGPANPLDLADARFELAQALQTADRDRDRAIALAREAQATFEQSASDGDRLADIRGWLEAQGG